VLLRRTWPGLVPRKRNSCDFEGRKSRGGGKIRKSEYGTGTMRKSEKAKKRVTGPKKEIARVQSGRGHGPWPLKKRGENQPKTKDLNEVVTLAGEKDRPEGRGLRRREHGASS